MTDLIVKQGIEKRLTDSVESVLHLSEGLLSVDVIGGEMLNSVRAFPVRIVGSVSKRSNQEVFHLIIPLGHVRHVMD